MKIIQICENLKLNNLKYQQRKFSFYVYTPIVDIKSYPHFIHIFVHFDSG